MKKLSADDKVIINMLYDQLSECSDGYGYLCDCDTTEVESSLSRLKLSMVVLLKLLCNLGFSMGSIQMPSVSGDKYEDLYDFLSYNETFFTDVMSLFGWEFSFINSEKIVDAILNECGSSFADMLFNDSNKFKELFIERVSEKDNIMDVEILYDIVYDYYTTYTELPIVGCMRSRRIGNIINQDKLDAEHTEMVKNIANPLLFDFTFEQGLRPDGSYGCYYLMSSTEPGADCTSMDYDMTKILDMILAEDYFKQIGL